MCIRDSPWEYYGQDEEITSLVDFIISPMVMRLGDPENLARLYKDMTCLLYTSGAPWCGSAPIQTFVRNLTIPPVPCTTWEDLTWLPL